MPRWNIQDSSCQLCHGAPGTLAHRYFCPCLRPSAGWPSPPEDVRRFLDSLSEVRRKWLFTRGMLYLRVPLPLSLHEGRFAWSLPPRVDDPLLATATWYFDGSLMLSKWPDVRATGFGIVVVGADGSLLAFGAGSPPGWCTTAAAAEAWALQEVLQASPEPPCMRTDCQTLLSTLRAGVEAAVDPKRPLARIWKRIAHVLDGDFQALHEAGRLVWMPAHCTLSAVGEVKTPSIHLPPPTSQLQRYLHPRTLTLSPPPFALNPPLPHSSVPRGF